MSRVMIFTTGANGESEVYGTRDPIEAIELDIRRGNRLTFNECWSGKLVSLDLKVYPKIECRVDGDD